MEIVALKCPECDGPFIRGTEICSYCGCGLIYKEEPIKEISITTPASSLGRRELLTGLVSIEINKITYIGCPKCFRKAEANCKHLCTIEPVELHWRKYLIMTPEKEYIMNASPLLGELQVGKSYLFDVFEKASGEYLITAIDDQAELRQRIVEKAKTVKELARAGCSLAEIKRTLEKMRYTT